ncbi:MAG TPA: tRNA (N(6)-L-threonylcarbamoyladenosine(37)-C(2))-methylthiotransferase MtaB [Anaerolineaceae bacterium]|nr:tRNA (N(6)-L-threonylcarbamoyladenosine(37)-C(2))-methylthiotransferase MtaB [Chloroflexota bacterium]HNY83813.1 tRNA (N(6)-L-threonylcarbamoyladenosine(37)-C(2))-methylthiotransferase MtaB [Anaerolineaceae bacterium]
MRSIYFDMVGCRLNQAEIEAFAREFCARGYKIVSKPTAADLIIVNTCCVTLKAAADSRKMVRHYQNTTSARVIGMGCWNSAFPDQGWEILGMANHFSNEQKDQLVETLAESCSIHKTDQKLNLGRRNRTRAFLKVQDGCNNACSYCLTQIARGRSRSISAQSIVETINSLEQAGINEVILTGVQIGSWGKDFGGERLNDLLEYILKHTNIPRIRLSSIEPWDITESLAKCWKNKRLCPHMHIPIQSGSDNILRSMRRPGNSSEIREVFRMLLKHIAGLAITTDIIVGFPGETEESFRETLDLIESTTLSGGHVFKYSPMPGTAAAAFAHQVSEAVKKDRLKTVRAMFKTKRHESMLKLIGSSAEVLFEGGRLGNYKEGYTPDFYRVKISSRETLENSIKTAKLIGIDEENNFLGEICGNSVDNSQVSA